MKDLGVALVREFQTVFGAYIGSYAEVPKCGEESLKKITSYADQAARLAEQLKADAQEMASSDPMGSLLLIRLQLIQEELAELAVGFQNCDVVESFDALVDLSYVVDGTYITLGLDGIKTEGQYEVHRSNMSKLDENGQPVISSAGRVVKGPLYSPPDLAKIIEAGATVI